MAQRTGHKYQFKPYSLQVGINWDHPMAQQLAHVYLFNENAGIYTRDLVTGDIAIDNRINADTHWQSGPQGVEYKQGASGGLNAGFTSQAVNNLGAASLTMMSSFKVGSPNGFLTPFFGSASGGVIYSSRGNASNLSPTFGYYSSVAAGGGTTGNVIFILDSSGVAVGSVGSIGLSAGSDVIAAGVYSRDTTITTYGGTWSVYINGQQDGTNNNFNLAGSFAGTFTSAIGSIGYEQQWTNSSDIIFRFIYIWRRDLNPQEIAYMSNNPYCFLTTPSSAYKNIGSVASAGGVFIPRQGIQVSQAIGRSNNY